MKKKHILSLLLTISILFSLTATASAATSSSNLKAATFNEYDYIKLLQESSPQELQEIGLTVKSANAIADEFKNALSARASLSNTQLAAYGYNNSEIAILHAYANGQELSAAQLRAVGSTCTGTIGLISCTTKAATFSYTWTWNRCPLVTLSDSAATRWVVYDANGGEIGVQLSSASMRIEYHFQGNAASSGSSAFAHYGYGENQPNLEFNTVNMQFPVYQAHNSGNGMILDCYAKTGKVVVSVTVPSGTSQNIHHIFVGGLYGHTLVGVGAPSVSIGASGSIAISFTGNLSIDPIASRKATIYRISGSVSYWS